MHAGSLISAILFLTLISAVGCSRRDPGKPPSEAEKEALQVLFREEWNKRFIECEDWFYTKSESPSTVYLGMQTNPEAWVYEWKPAAPAEDGRKVSGRCTVFIKSQKSTVHTGGSWLRPFKQETGYLVAADIMHDLPGPKTPAERRDFLEAQCTSYQTCVGLDVIRYADGSREILDSGKYWSELRKPQDCGEIPR